MKNAALLTALLILPVLIHHNARNGYFEDDDLDALTWARQVSPASLLPDIPDVRYNRNARPIGFIYDTVLAHQAGLHYTPWLISFQFFGLVNVALLWLVLRKLGLDAIAAASGCLFFILSRTLFDAWWKPMFIFDVLCSTFALLSLLAYTQRYWVASFIAFWLAVRSKEVGIAAPAILLAYEMILGERKWKRVLWFLVPAAIYGAGGLWFNQHLGASHTYRMGFTPAALRQTVSFYAPKLFWVPYAGLLVLILPLVVRDRKMYFGLAAFLCAIGIYMVLPGRMEEAYLYLPLAGIAVMIAALCQRHPRVLALLALAWIPWQVHLLARQARATMAQDDERRALVSALASAPDAPVYVYTGEPAFEHYWGVAGALRLFHGGSAEVHRLFEDGLPASKPMKLLQWDSATRNLSVGDFVGKDHTELAPATPIAAWQFAKGWQPASGNYRGMRGAAAVDLYKPAAASAFFWEACGAKGTELRTFVNGLELLPPFVFSASGCTKKEYALPAGPAFFSRIDYLANPADDVVSLGTFGFRSDILKR